jgi:hypothetical protein
MSRKAGLFETRKSLSGKCYYKSKTISAPKPVTRKSLYIFLHECAHAHLHAPLYYESKAKYRRKPSHVIELEAEQWAHEKMREHNVPVPRSITKRAKEYVGWKIDQAVARGAKNIDPDARRYANKELPKRKARELVELEIVLTVRGYRKLSHIDFRIDDGDPAYKAREALIDLAMKIAKEAGIDTKTANYGSRVGTKVRGLR